MFNSFIMGGFECSSHIQDGVRLDLIESTGHGRFVRKDYRALQKMGIHTVREGLRWNLIDWKDGYDFRSVGPFIRAANEYNTQVMWDLCHYGFPDDVCVEDEDFTKRFVLYSRYVLEYISKYLDDKELLVCPFNEPSFLSKAIADFGYFNSSVLAETKHHEGLEVKKKLVKAMIAVIKDSRDRDINVKWVHVDPLIHIAYNQSDEKVSVLDMREWQYQSLDMMLGRIFPELGGDESLIDIIGVNHYPYSTWMHGGSTLDMNHPYRHSLSKLLDSFALRYPGKPLFISETGMEGEGREEWFNYVLEECDKSKADIRGVCLYPVTDYPGWGDNRHCPCGLLGYPTPRGRRDIHEPLRKCILAYNRKLKRRRNNT